VPAAMLGLPVPVEAVWGAIATELADRLDSAATPGAMLDIFEAALLARVRPVAGLGLVHDTSTQTSQSAGSLSIASLTEAAGVSSTHLAARFKHLVGITPKRLARTYRFAEIVKSINPACEVWFSTSQLARSPDSIGA
jgi:AraC-like DNA-binding protein